MGGAGAPAALASLLGEEIIAVTASGTTQLTRAQSIAAGNSLGMGFNTVTTSGGNTAVQILDSFPVGRSTFVNVTSATSAVVYPPDGCTIQGGATNAAITVAQNSPVEIFRTSRTAFIGLTAVTSTGSTGTVTSVTSGTGLSGGPITTSGTLTIDFTPVIISAAGSIQGDATLIAGLDNVVTTVGSGQGVVLPASSRKFPRNIVNKGANTLKIYPNSGGTINGGGTDVPVTIVPNQAVRLGTADDLTWWPLS
jgi:hypothetical protein